MARVTACGAEPEKVPFSWMVTGGRDGLVLTGEGVRCDAVLSVLGPPGPSS